jgi:DNA-binding NtrC family response regulator
MNGSPFNLKSACAELGRTGPTILLVEDETDVCEVTRAVLEHAGYRVLESNGPEEALRLGSEHRGAIGLLLSDVVMPGMNGPELALRLQDLQPGLITVFMSGYADRDLLHRVMGGALTTYIQKPFTIEILLSGVAKALRGQAQVNARAPLSGLSAG